MIKGEKNMASDINSAELCLKAVRVLQDELRKAKKTLINSENCVVNRGVMTAQLEYLQDNLPDDNQPCCVNRIRRSRVCLLIFILRFCPIFFRIFSTI